MVTTTWGSGVREDGSPWSVVRRAPLSRWHLPGVEAGVATLHPHRLIQAATCCRISRSSRTISRPRFEA
jgi:hypothetical protein